MTNSSAGRPKRSDVNRALKGILNSKQFADSTQLRDFLKFIVSKTLDGEQDEIKAYTIAVDALGRREDFDPQTNAAVRVAAGRLRQALALYNAQETPVDSPVRIVLEPGSYIPSFETFIVDDVSPDAEDELEDVETPVPPSPIEQQDIEPVSLQATPVSVETDIVPDKTSSSLPFYKTGKLRFLFAGAAIVLATLGLNQYLQSASPTRSVSSPDLQATPQNSSVGLQGPTVGSVTANSVPDVNLRPSINVTYLLPDAPYPDWFKTNEIADALRIALARFDDYKFDGLRTFNIAPGQTENNSDYNLRVTSYRRGDNVRMYGQLTNRTTQEVIWSHEQLFKRPYQFAERSMPEVTGSIIAELASPYGVIYSDLLRNQPKRPDLNCVVWTYRYFNSESNETHKKARDCAEDLANGGSVLSKVYSSLTFLYLDEYREDRNRLSRDPIFAAEQMAVKAIQLNPTSARAHQALFAVHKVRGNRSAARRNAEKALERNPYDIDILADFGAWLVSIGENEPGRALLKRAARYQSAPPAWMEFYRFMAAEIANDTTEADAVASVLDYKRSPLSAIAVAISARRAGNNTRADNALDELVKVEPEFKIDPNKRLLIRGFDEAVAKQVVGKLIDAGLEVIVPPSN